MSHLFSPITLGRHVFPNRIVAAPMAQYSAIEGSAVPWHAMHLGRLAVSGAGLVMIEGTCVEQTGRTTPGCLGLYSDANAEALGEVVRQIRSYSQTRLGIQLMHAGRKGSASVLSQGGAALSAAEGAWETLAPSRLPFKAGWPLPREATVDDLQRIQRDFVDNALRAVRIGIDVIELHAAHGYLLHQFLSPLSNHRTDAYGGSSANRMRFPLQVFDAVRAACPASVVGVRITGSDWVEGGIAPDAALAFARALQARGCDYVDVSSGGIDPTAKITVGPGYQVGFAAAIRQGTGMPVRAVGLIHSPQQAEDIIASGQADMVALARTLLAHPQWPWRAAHELGAALDYPPPYQRAAPGKWPGWAPTDIPADIPTDIHPGQRPGTARDAQKETT